MPTHKPDLSRLSLTQLRDLTGFAFKTITKRLEGLAPVGEDGKTVWYSPKEALPKLYGFENPLAERMRLDSARADLAELDLQVKRGELLHGEDVDLFLLGLFGAFTQRVRAIPPKAAPEVRATGSDAEAEARLAAFHDEALTELAEAARGAADRVARRGAGEATAFLRGARGGAKAAAAADGERVGGRGEKALARVKRGAGAVEDGEG